MACNHCVKSDTHALRLCAVSYSMEEVGELDKEVGQIDKKVGKLC